MRVYVAYPSTLQTDILEALPSGTVRTGASFAYGVQSKALLTIIDTQLLLHRRRGRTPVKPYF